VYSVFNWMIKDSVSVGVRHRERERKRDGATAFNDRMIPA
jgi:hypothetical protein